MRVQLKGVGQRTNDPGYPHMESSFLLHGMEGCGHEHCIQSEGGKGLKVLQVQVSRVPANFLQEVYSEEVIAYVPGRVHQ